MNVTAMYAIQISLHKTQNSKKSKEVFRARMGLEVWVIR